MVVHFFTKGDKSIPSSRYRAYYLAEALESIGHETNVTPVINYSLTAFLSYTKQLLVLPQDNIIFLQRTIYNKYFYIAVLIAYVFGRRFIFDIDDAVYEHSPLKTILLVKLAKKVTCGSEYIHLWALRWNRNSYVLKNGLPLSIYTPRVMEPKGVPIIGWIGDGPAHYENLKNFLPVLEELSNKKINFFFRLIGASNDIRVHNLFLHLPQVQIIDSLKWSDPKEAVCEIHKFFIGVMPLNVESWNEPKYFKAIEYMACSVPVVASPCGTLRHIFKKGDCGFIATSKDVWVARITSLINSSSLREDEGRKGRAVIEKNYSSKLIAKKLIEIISFPMVSN